MGTTVCAARFALNKKRVYLAHVGDSSRAVGIWPTVPIDIVMAVPEPDDVYLLCSDGLTKMLPDEAIAEVLRSEEDLTSAVERLVASANACGGKDNISVVLVTVVPPNWKPRPSTPAA